MSSPDYNATQWRYGRWSPPPSRMAMDELEGHRFSYYHRTEKLLGKERQYRATCTCKDWAHTEWRTTRAMARRDFLRHVNAAQHQLRMPV